MWVNYLLKIIFYFRRNEHFRKEKREDLLCTTINWCKICKFWWTHCPKFGEIEWSPLPPNIKHRDSLQAVITPFYMNIMILSYFSVNVIITLNFAFHVSYPSTVLRSRYKRYTSGEGFGEKNKMKKGNPLENSERKRCYFFTKIKWKTRQKYRNSHICSVLL